MLVSMNSKVMSLLSNKKFLFYILIVAIFVGAAIFVYINYVKPKMNTSYVANKEYQNQQNDDNQSGESADLYFFYTNWCPHCKSAKPVMAKLVDYLHSQNGMVNNVQVNYIPVDCEADKQTAERFEVEGYPTIKLVYGTKVIEYDAKPDLETLKQFLNTSL